MTKHTERTWTPLDLGPAGDVQGGLLTGPTKVWSSLVQAHLAVQKSEQLAREASTPDTVEVLTRVAEALA